MPTDPPIAKGPHATLRPLQLSPLLMAAKSQTIRDLCEAIRKYNFLLPTFQLQQRANRAAYTLDKTGAALLDRMCALVMTYLASKPPASRKQSGQDKWRGAAAFVQQLHAHAEHFNIKLLHGDFQEEHNYWMERFDPEHGDLGEWPDFRAWMRKTDKAKFLRRLACTSSPPMRGTRLAITRTRGVTPRASESRSPRSWRSLIG